MIYGKGVSVIEWSEKIMEELPSSTIIIKLEAQSDGSRLISIENWNDSSFIDDAEKYIIKDDSKN